jgi:hypothetical protein
MDARWRRKTSGASADDEVVWSWRRDAGVKFRGIFREATVAKEPGHRGEHEISRKAIAQGMFWRKSINKINGKTGVCPPLCRDPLRPYFFNNLSVEARPRALRSLRIWEITHRRGALRRGRSLGSSTGTLEGLTPLDVVFDAACPEGECKCSSK